MRVVIDTNVVVSSFLSSGGPPARIMAQWIDNAFELVVSEAMLQEYRRALGYDRTRKRHGFSLDQVDNIVSDFRKLGTVVEAQVSLSVVRDPDDNKVLECAIAGEADFIVTGDVHLLELGQYRGIAILTPAVFLAALGMEGNKEDPDIQGE